MSIITKKEKPLLRLCKKKLHWYPLIDKGCKECRKAYQKEYVQKNKKTLKENQQSYYQKNKEKIKQRTKQRQQKNRNYCIEYQKKHYKENKSTYQKYFKEYLKRNKKALVAKAAEYKASKIKATPAWANKKLIETIYKNCPEGFHVDHIYPLRSPLMCGLHTENNLQYLKAETNTAKKNKVNLEDQLIEIEPANWVYLLN
jgi:hypothetical protein